MKKTNFLKGLALAAVVLVGGFATSCSEEELSIKGGQTEITLPDASASVSISVVDLEEGKLVGSVTTIDATSAIGSTMTVECPANAGYTTAAAVEVAIPALQKGQSVNVPVTFYVVTLESALAKLVDDTYLSWTKVTEDMVSKVEVNDFASTYPAGWVNGTFTNTDTDAIFVEAGVNAVSGWEYVSEITSEEDESTESKAAETTIVDLLKLNKPNPTISWWSTELAGMNMVTLNPEQVIWTGNATLKKYSGEIIAKFVAKQYMYVLFNPEFDTIDHAGHDAPTHDGHDGHGHGGNSNAGGGIGGDDAGE